MINATGFPESYYEIKSTKSQKQAFINILKPLIDKSNKKILEERSFVQKFFLQAMNNSFRNMNPNDLKKLQRLSKKYRIRYLFNKTKYLKRIDIIPAPLALAQGAIESGWGKSRFVRAANNIFGHWTWGEVGIIPLGREEGKTHKIRIFTNLQSSVNEYMLNLNRHSAYQELRDKRYQKRLQGKEITAFEAADTMINYSGLGEKYIEILYKMMKEHNLLYHNASSKKLVTSKVGL